MPSLGLTVFAFALTASFAAAQTTEPAELRRGSFHITFNEQSPLSPIEAQNKRHHIKVEPMHRYNLPDESFEVHLPEDYDPDRPYGILVWVHAMDSGAPPKSWIPTLSQHQLIWIGANNSGNERGIGVRFALALDAVHNLKKLYNIDESRIYVSGISGGGKVATMLAIIYPEIFNGAIPIVGVTYFRHVPLPDQKGKFWPGMFEKPPNPTLERARRQSRFVLVTGSGDFNRESIRGTYENGFLKDGFEHVEYVEVPGMEHALPDVQWIDRAIESLDAPLVALAKDQFAKAIDLEKGGKLGEAQKLYAQSAAHGGDAIASRAEDRLALLLQKRDEQIIRAHRAAEEKRYVDAANLLVQLIEQFGSSAPIEARELLESLKRDPAAAAQIKASADKIAAQQREAAATTALDAARQLATRDLKRGYEALKKITRDFPDTPAALQASVEAENLLADPANRAALETDPNETEAQHLLQMAENYQRNNLRKEAIERLERILRDYPNTKSAAKAKQLIENLR